MISLFVCFFAVRLVKLLSNNMFFKFQRFKQVKRTWLHQQTAWTNTFTPAKWYTWMKGVPRKLAEGFDSRSGHTDDLKNGSFGLSGLVIGIRMRRNASCAVLPIVCHLCSIHCKSSQYLIAIATWPMEARSHGGHSEAVSPKFFCASKYLFVTSQFVFKRIMKTKIFPPEMYFPSPNFKT